jgi:hypothetical protein
MTGAESEAMMVDATGVSRRPKSPPNTSCHFDVRAIDKKSASRGIHIWRSRGLDGQITSAADVA